MPDSGRVGDGRGSGIIEQRRLGRAYRMLGSVSEAKDVVQEALLRVHRALDAGERIASPWAFVATVTTRLAINELRSARPPRALCRRVAARADHHRRTR